MFKTFFNFEIRTWLKAPMPYIFLLLIGLICGAAAVSDNVTIGGGFGNIYKNAPYVTMNWYMVFSLITVLLVTSFVNAAAIRDFEKMTDQIVFSKPISKSSYYFGHFWGALLISMLPLLGVSLGMWAGIGLNGFAEWIDPIRFGAFEIESHLMAWVVFVIPNAIFVGGFLYAIAAKTKSTIYPFVAAALLLVAYGVSQSLMRDIEYETIGSLLDPFGGRAFGVMTKYWTVNDKNTMVVGLSGLLLINRVIWVSVGIIALMIGYRTFSFDQKSSKKKKSDTVKTDSSLAIRHLGVLPKFTPKKGLSTQMIQLWSQYKTEVLGIVKSVPFILIAFLGLLNTVPNFFFANDAYGTHELPTTYVMIGIIQGAFYLFSTIIMVYFSGFLVWKERNAKMDEIYDSLPVKNWTVYLGKYLSIMTVMVLLTVIVIIAAIIAQKSMGYTQHNYSIYIRELLVMDMLSFAFIMAFSMFVHSLSKNMYLGFAIVIGFLFALDIGLDTFNISTNMLDFGSRPSYTLSDFYGYEPFFKGLNWFNGYWLAFSLLLALGAFLFWSRGKEAGFKKRYSIARQEWNGYRFFGMGALLAFGLVGGWVYYNTFQINSFNNNKEQELLLVHYEKEYKKLTKTPQPRIYEVKYDIDLTPENRAMVANGQYRIKNQSGKTVDSLLVNVPNNGAFDFHSERLSLLKNDSAVYFRIYAVSPPLQPGDSMLLDFTTHFVPKGFENEVTFSKFVQNGAFFNNSDISPSFGYSLNGGMSDKQKRKKYNLPERTRFPELNRTDTLNRMSTYISPDADWVMVETIIRTAPDQIAIAPGSLRKEWEENGRRCFHYKLDQKAWNFYSFMSARYEVARKEHHGVKLEVYHHPSHTYNVDRMLQAMAKSLDYFTTNFGPYYHKQCRIIEFPRFSSFAQAFPGTMPYSESVGFIQDFKPEEDDLDIMFYVAAHEIGHQWWAHQECGAAMQGAELTTETLAQYSAIMVMEKEYGRDQMRKFMKYEMDKYLRGRGRETEKEMPLARCEGQGYAHYNKGSVVMYYLKEMISEDSVNLALQRFLGKFKYQKPPYPVSLDLIDEFYKVTPDSLDYIVKDLFEDITIFENRCEKVEAEALENGKFKVTIHVSCKKYKSDEMGKESEVPINDFIEIGAFAKPEGDKDYGKTLYRERVKINSPENTFSFIVDEKPHEAGIDPFLLLIDKEPKDNLKNVKTD